MVNFPVIVNYGSKTYFKGKKHLEYDNCHYIYHTIYKCILPLFSKKISNYYTFFFNLEYLRDKSLESWA